MLPQIDNNSRIFGVVAASFLQALFHVVFLITYGVSDYSRGFRDQMGGPKIRFCETTHRKFNLFVWVFSWWLMIVIHTTCRENLLCFLRRSIFKLCLPCEIQHPHKLHQVYLFCKGAFWSDGILACWCILGKTWCFQNANSIAFVAFLSNMSLRKW